MECPRFRSAIIITLVVCAQTINTKLSNDVRKIDLRLNRDKFKNGNGKDITKVHGKNGVLNKGEVGRNIQDISSDKKITNNEWESRNTMVGDREMESRVQEIKTGKDKWEIDSAVEKSRVKRQLLHADRVSTERERNRQTRETKSERGGILTSPNYPNKYRDNDNINKIIDLGILHNFSLTLQNFSLEDYTNDKTCLDTFTLYKGRQQIKDNILIGPICGILKNINITNIKLCSWTKNKLACTFVSDAFRLIFKTDKYGKYTGYQLNYSSTVATPSEICDTMLKIEDNIGNSEPVQISTSFLAIGNKYPSGLNCNWNLPQHRSASLFIDTIIIKLVYFSIKEAGPSCVGDGTVDRSCAASSDDSVRIMRVITSTANSTSTTNNTSPYEPTSNSTGNNTHTLRTENKSKNNSGQEDVLLEAFYGCICPVKMTKFDVEKGIRVTFNTNANTQFDDGGFKLNIITKTKKRKILKYDTAVKPSPTTIRIHELLTDTLICPLHSVCLYILKFTALFLHQIHLQIIGNKNGIVRAYDGPDRGYKKLNYGKPNFKKDMFGWYDKIYPKIGYLSEGPYLTIVLNRKSINSTGSLHLYSRSVFLDTSYRHIECTISGASMGVLSRTRTTTVNITRSKLNATNHFCYVTFVIPHGLHLNVDITINKTSQTNCALSGALIFIDDKFPTGVCRNIPMVRKNWKDASRLQMLLFLYAKEGEERDAALIAHIYAIHPADIGTRSAKLIDSCSKGNIPSNVNDQSHKRIYNALGFIDLTKSEKGKPRIYDKKRCNVILSFRSTSALLESQYIELCIHTFYGYKLQIKEYIKKDSEKTIVKILTAGRKRLLLTHVTFKSVSAVKLDLELTKSIATMEYQLKTYTDAPNASISNYRSHNIKLEADTTSNYTAFFNNLHYTLNNISNVHNLTVAEDFCIRQGGHLFSASTVDELETIKSTLATRWIGDLLHASQSQTFWFDVLIGLHKQGSMGWRWTDGSPLTISDWYYPDILDHYIPEEIQKQRQDMFTVQPVEDRGYNCTTMGIHSPRQSTNWLTVDCQHIPQYVNLFICEIPDTSLKSSMLHNTVSNTGWHNVNTHDNSATYKYGQFISNITCPTNWIYIDGQCWLMLHTKDSSHQETRNMTKHKHYHNIGDAKGGCEEFGGDIADLMDVDTVKKYMAYTQHHEQYGNVWVLQKGKSACVQYRLKRDLNDKETDRLEIITHTDEECVSRWIIEEEVKKNERMYSEINKNYFSFQCNYERKWFNTSNVEVYTATCYPNHVFCVRDVVLITKTCQTGYLECKDHSCVSPDLRCDNRSDCADGEDEENCALDDYFYLCTNMDRITISKYCDHVKDCSDGSDEEGCVYPPCSDGQFRCDNGQCVEGTKRCNGLRDGCVDWSDETDCTRGHCVNGFFCSEGCIRTCINEKRKNDGMSDCRYGVDEPHMSKYSKDYHIKAVKQNCSAEEGRCAVRNEGCFNRGDACVLGYDSDGRMKGCRDGTHLTNCSMFECPGRYKCPQSYCIDMKQVCDGVQDCRFGEDEAECDDTRSPGLYRCGEKQTHSIDGSQVCDGEFDCGHYHSDEKYCSLPKCPQGCTCRGFYYNCEGNITDDISIGNVNFSSLARTLNLARNNLMDLTPFHFARFPFLAILRLAYNHISEIDTTTLKNLHNLRILDLRHNNLKSLGQETFRDLGRLTIFSLKGNEFAILLPRTFIGMSQISNLNLSHLKIKIMRSECLRGLTNLTMLDLSGNINTQIDRGVFNRSQKLKIVILTNNTLSNTKDLEAVIGNITSDSLKAGTFRFCCIRNKTRTRTCTPDVDIYSSCADLMSNHFLQIAIWVIGCLAFIGNISVIIFRPIMGIKSPSEICIFALSCSDFLTGLYLVILASVDTHYRDRYIVHDEKWKGSALCQVCGIISTLSSQLSSFLLLLITLDRFIHLVFPMKGIRYSRRSTVIVCVILFIFSFVSAIIPISFPEYFGDAYYSKTALCLAYDFTSRSQGWEYTVGMFISVNLFNCILTLVFYVTIFCSVRHSSKKSDPTRKGDIALTKTLFLLVLTDLACWFPLIIASLYVINGGKVKPDMAAMLAVVVLPINAALNPYLYTISSVQNARSRRRTKRHDRKLLGQGSHPAAPSRGSPVNPASRKTAITCDSSTARAYQDGRKQAINDTENLQTNQPLLGCKTNRVIPKMCSIEDNQDTQNMQETTISVIEDSALICHRRNQLLAGYGDSNDAEGSSTHDICEAKHDNRQEGSVTIALVHAEPASAECSNQHTLVSHDADVSVPNVPSPNIHME